MNYSTTLTQKGQVTIPVQIRQEFNLQSGQKITFFKKNNRVFIEPAKDFLSLQGSIHTKNFKKYSDEKADEAVLKYFSSNKKD
jgi:AbrB family looped-hinge helix DNA binding protein